MNLFKRLIFGFKQETEEKKEYATDLEQVKQLFPFDRWHKAQQEGLEIYTKENCDKAREIFNRLISDLIYIGPNSSEARKIRKFKTAILALNNLNAELGHGFIETMEREDLCELINAICQATGVNPEKYGDGEGPASEWREW